VLAAINKGFVVVVVVVVVTVDTLFDIVGREIIANGSLYLQKMNQQDAGVYICIAENSAGTAFGQIRLRVLSMYNLWI